VKKTIDLAVGALEQLLMLYYC